MRNLLIYILLTQFSVYAQIDTLWTKTIGAGGRESGGMSCEGDSGCIYIAGLMGTPTNDRVITKMTVNGEIKWTKFFGGDQADPGNKILRSLDGNYISFGYSKSYGANGYDFCAIKFDPNGNEIWHKIYGGPGTDLCRNVIRTDDGGFIMVGQAGANGFGWGPLTIMKIDSAGNQLWQKLYPRGYYSEAYDIKKTMDDNYIVLGGTANSTTELDWYMLKIKPDGDTLWTRQVGQLYDDCGFNILPTADNGYIGVGFQSDQNYWYDLWIIKFDQNGDTLWSRKYGNPNVDDGAYSIIPLDNGDYLVGGYYGNENNMWDVWILQIDQSGNLLYNAKYGGAGDEEINGLMRLSDNSGIIAVGLTNSYGAGDYDIWVLKLKPDGILPVELTSFTAEAIADEVLLKWKTASETNNRGFDIERKTGIGWEKIAFVSGKINSTSPNSYSYLDDIIGESGVISYRLKQIDLDGSYTYSEIAEVSLNPDEFTLEQNFPNPFNPSTVIGYRLKEESLVKLTLFNSLGSEATVLINENKQAGEHEYKLNSNALGLSSGVYFYELKSGGNIQRRKMILLR